MAEKHLTDGTTALAAQPRVIKIEAAEKPRNAQLRVAAYTRVSSDSDDQLNSFAAQNRYYAELISGKAEWRMVDIYADEGITGTSAAKREDFQRMMADCRRGLIDQILVKSISRFTRNTKDCLEAVRELKELGVNVRFEREGIDTANVSSELITAIYAAFAQKESESISGNMRWSYQRRIESGEFNTCRAPWGFRLDGKSLAVHEEEAEIVRRIFLEYLSGRNPREIAEILNAEDTSGRIWKYKAVDYILQNERYAGNALLQKRYTTATLPKQQKINHGEREMYYVADSNEAIIPQELFDRAKELRQRRSVGQAVTHGRLCVRMRCSCGSRIRAKQVNSRWYWCCCRHDEKGDCAIKPVPERRRMKPSAASTISERKAIRHSSSRSSSARQRKRGRQEPARRRKRPRRRLCGTPPSERVEKIVTDLLNELIRCPDRIQPAVSQVVGAACGKTREELTSALELQPIDEDNARALLLQLAAEQYDAIGNTEYETVRLRRLLTGRKPMTEPDAELLQSTVSKVRVTNKCVTVTLKNGQTIERRDQP